MVGPDSRPIKERVVARLEEYLVILKLMWKEAEAKGNVVTRWSLPDVVVTRGSVEEL